MRTDSREGGREGGRGLPVLLVLFPSEIGGEGVAFADAAEEEEGEEEEEEVVDVKGAFGQ